jgi:hypothetical protein
MALLLKPSSKGFVRLLLPPQSRPHDVVLHLDDVNTGEGLVEARVETSGAPSLATAKTTGKRYAVSYLRLVCILLMALISWTRAKVNC